ncbi:MFS transporter [Agromyces rhizosphaerae]|uniref:MFS transporter n=1 Tax=Agromyces rhizosphaerae TaxID=88374 RepID=A0A9W6CPS5_9MICO|nr:sugar porter family MFS transporter [Agromyces rhizosphaerae]GLI26278.1 MFS transporter [Agromyces rhizosphaerae]
MGELRSVNKGKVIWLASAGAVGGFLFGFDSSVINGAVEPIQAQFGLNATTTGIAVASALLGCAFGAWLGGRVADRFGRIPSMVLAATLFFISALGSGMAFGVWDLIAWRLIGGVGVGMASVIAPAYIAEISPAAVRGRLASLQQLAITTGIFAALLSDAVFAALAGGADQPFWLGAEAWRWMFLAEAVPAAAYGLIALTLLESPRYLVLQNREHDAVEVLLKIGGEKAPEDEVRAIQEDLERDRKLESFSTLKGHAFGLKPIVWVGIALSVFQQFVGINVIFYYSNTLWQSVGFDESSSFAISVFTSIVNIAVTIVAISLIDKVGRRPLLLTGSIGMTVSLGTMAICFSQATIVDGAPVLEGAFGPIALVAANLFVIFFGVSWGPAVWVLLGEIFPNSIRGKALGLAAAAQWIANFLITVSFPALAGLSLVFTYGMYAAFAALSFLFVLRFIPETRGRSLEESGHLERPVARSRAK